MSYIANTLGNMAAAEHLIDQVEAKILDYQQNLTVATVYAKSPTRPNILLVRSRKLHGVLRLSKAM
ncbi:MAG: hypothetical protein V8T51_08020 [Senegalimassilia faecalis]